jgi:thiol-disulfide isomerase/thioredoxin
MKRIYCLALALLFLHLAFIPVFPQPSYAFLQKTFTKTITSLTALPGAGVLLCFSDGTCSIIDRQGRAAASQLISPGREIFYMKPGLNVSSSVVAVDRSGNLYFLNTSTLAIMNAFLAKKNDETSFLLASLSGDGRYLAVSSRYYVKVGDRSYPETRLAVIDTAAQKRIFERDLNTKDDVLVEVFSIDFWGNYLVAETIDTKCELCQLTDNRIEVYRIDQQTVKKMASFQSGLTSKLIVGNFLVAQRAQPNGTNGYLTYVFRLPYLSIETRKVLGKIQSFIPFNNDSFLAVFSDGTLRMCNLKLDCADLVAVPTSRAVVASDGTYIAIFKTGEVEVYAISGKPSRIAYYRVAWDVAPSPPRIALGSLDSFYCVYGDSMLIAALKVTTVKLALAVVDDRGAPAGGAVVEVSSRAGPSQTFITSENGTVTIELTPGSYEISVKKVGYTPVTLTQDITSDTCITLKITRRQEQRQQVQLSVLGEDGSPVSQAKVEIIGRENITVTTDAYGKALVNLPLGKYTLIANAPKYKSLTRDFEVTANMSTLTVRLELEKVNVFLESPERLPGGIIVVASSMTKNNYTAMLVPSTNISLPVDIYQVQVKSPSNYSCTASPSILNVVNGISNYRVRVLCKPLQSPAIHVQNVTVFLEKSMVQSSKPNASLKTLPVITLLNSTRLDLNAAQESRILVIEFFYTQCTGCKYLVPVLRNLSKLPGVTVVSLTVSPLDTPSVLNRYIAENNVTWIVARDENDLASEFNVSVFPTVLVLTNGKVVFKGMGARGELEAAKNVISVLGNFTSLLNTPISTILRSETLILFGGFLVLAWLAIGGRYEERDSEEDSFDADTDTLPGFSHSLRRFNA